MGNHKQAKIIKKSLKTPPLFKLNCKELSSLQLLLIITTEFPSKKTNPEMTRLSLECPVALRQQA